MIKLTAILSTVLFSSTVFAAGVSKIPDAQTAITKVMSDNVLMSTISNEIGYPGFGAALGNVSVEELSGNQFRLKLTYDVGSATCIVHIGFNGSNYEASIVRSTTCVNK